jgi:hypothetical protein
VHSPEPVRDRGGCGWPGPQWLPFPGQSVVAFTCGALAGDCPQRVAQVLLGERDLGLDGELDVGQGGGLAAVGRDPSQDPGRALAVHQPAGAVDRVNQHPQLSVVG